MTPLTFAPPKIGYKLDTKIETLGYMQLMPRSHCGYESKTVNVNTLGPDLLLLYCVFTLPDIDTDTDTDTDTNKMGLQPNCICVDVCVCVTHFADINPM